MRGGLHREPKRGADDEDDAGRGGEHDPAGTARGDVVCARDATAGKGRRKFLGTSGDIEGAFDDEEMGKTRAAAGQVGLNTIVPPFAFAGRGLSEVPPRKRNQMCVDYLAIHGLISFFSFLTSALTRDFTVPSGTSKFFAISS